MTGPTPLLTVENLTLRRAGRRLFPPLGLRLMPGELLVLEGANGAGKSSLLLALAGVLRPETGTIARRDDAALHLVGHAAAVKPRLTLGENLAFWRDLNGGTGVAGDAALAAVGLAGLGGIEASHLSAGQTRRLALARLLVSDRPLWLLDEPTASLDSAGAGIVAALIAARRASGGGVIAASHDTLAGATRTLVLAGGEA